METYTVSFRIKTTPQDLEGLLQFLREQIEVEARSVQSEKYVDEVLHGA